MRTPRFTVTSDGGKLIATGRAPAAVRTALEALDAEARWRRVEIRGGASGLVVRRRVRARDATKSLWQDDLWLAEHLAEAVAASRP